MSNVFRENAQPQLSVDFRWSSLGRGHEDLRTALRDADGKNLNLTAQVRSGHIYEGTRGRGGNIGAYDTKKGEAKVLMTLRSGDTPPHRGRDWLSLVIPKFSACGGPCDVLQKVILDIF